MKVQVTQPSWCQEGHQTVTHFPRTCPNLSHLHGAKTVIKQSPDSVYTELLSSSFDFPKINLNPHGAMKVAKPISFSPT